MGPNCMQHNTWNILYDNQPKYKDFIQFHALYYITLNL